MLLSCDRCKSRNIVLDANHGEYYCSDCGLVAEQALDYSMHWYGDKGTSYYRTTYTRTYKGQGAINPNKLARCKGMKVTEEENIERNFSTALPALRAIWGAWQVPQHIREDCAIRYRKMIRKGITHGRNSHAMAIAATFLVCKEYGITRDWKELAKSLELSTVPVEKCLKAIASSA